MKKLIQVIGYCSIVLALANCGTQHQPLAIVEQQVSENKLVASNAIRKNGLLDAYHHLLPEPEKLPAELNLAVSKSFISSEGDSVVLQVGLASQQPKKSQKQFHYLIKRPVENVPSLNEKLDKLVAELISIEGYGMMPTFDWSMSAIDDKKYPSLINADETTSLDKFLRRYLIGLESYNEKHFVIVMADHTELWQSQQQNVADMAAYLASKGATVSVLAIGADPKLAFYQKIAEKGKGLLALKTDSLDLQEWFDTEEAYISARSINDLNLKVSMGKNIRFKRALTGETVNLNDDVFTYPLKSFKQGEQRVSLFELTVPLMMLEAEQQLAKVELSFYDNATGLYYSDEKVAAVTYSNDLNQINTSHSDLVNRSLTILNTADVIGEAAQLVQNKRPYQAMNVVSGQKQALKEISARLKDSETQRDAEILGKYEKRLFEFADESFQSIKAWMDLNLDKERFSSAIE